MWSPSFTLQIKATQVCCSSPWKVSFCRHLKREQERICPKLFHQRLAKHNLYFLFREISNHWILCFLAVLLQSLSRLQSEMNSYLWKPTLCALSLISQIEEGSSLSALSVKGTPKNVLNKISLRCSPKFPEWHFLNLISTEFFVFNPLYCFQYNLEIFSPNIWIMKYFGGRRRVQNAQ